MIFFSIFRETDNKYFFRTFTINLIPDLLKNRFIGNKTRKYVLQLLEAN